MGPNLMAKFHPQSLEKRDRPLSSCLLFSPFLPVPPHLPVSLLAPEEQEELHKFICSLKIISKILQKLPIKTKKLKSMLLHKK